MGRAVLEHLAAGTWPARVVACRRDERRGAEACRLARVVAAAAGTTGPDLEFAPLDLADADMVAGLLARVRPSLVILTASLQTWWLASLLPSEAARPLRGIGFGAWLPLHLPVLLSAMRSLSAARYEGPVLSAPFPDVTGPVLDRIGLAPTCGVGNVAEVVPKLRLLAAARLRTDPARVEVTLVAHHALLAGAFRPADAPAREPLPPHFLRIRVDGEDVTEAVDAEGLLVEPWSLPGGGAWASLTAACTVRLARALLAPRETRLHAPSPGGLPGGYPVLVGGGSVRPEPIDGLSFEEAIRLNERSHPFDGIERIEPDGTAVFTGRVCEAMRDTLGFDCPRLAPSEAAGRGEELRERFERYAAGHGVDLSAARI